MKYMIKKIKNNKITIFLLVALIMRLFLHDTLTYTLDVNTYIAWGHRLQEVGFGQFYQQWSDYLPGYLYVLWFLAGVERLFGGFGLLLYKLPAILADLGVGYLVYKIVLKKTNQHIALLAASFLLFNPAIFANSTLWGQVDIVTSLFSLLAIYFYPQNKWLSALALALGIAVKPQAILAAPVIFALMLKHKEKFKHILLYGILATLIFIVLFLPFSGNEDIASFILTRINATVTQYQYTSVNAFNFWGLSGFWNPDTNTSSLSGLMVTVISSIVIALLTFRKKIDPYAALALLVGVHFMFFTRMHERHILPMLPALLIAAFIYNRKLLVSYVGLSITYLANLWYSYYWTVNDFASPYPSWVITLLIIANLLLISWIFLNKHLRLKTDYLWPKFDKKDALVLTKKTKKYLLIGILLFAALTRLYGLHSPDHEYFDEVYHAFTARIIVDGDPKAWEWWNPHPEGFAYEWTHPPFAKLAMAGSMLIFGQNSFAWRLPAAVFGVGVVYLVYLVGKQLFKSEEVGILASAIVALDGLVLVMSRIGMNDIYLLFFLLLCFYLFLKEKYFFSALFWGFALASKWSAVWILPLLALAFMSQRRKFDIKILYFVLVPPIVYLGAYFPMFVTGHDINLWWGMQKQMWWYHTGLEAEHAYTSPWWSWPLLLRPVWLFVERAPSVVSNIYALGNPVIACTGLVSITLGLYSLFYKRNKALGLAIFGWMIFFIPWSLSPRIMFYYHYLPAMPFLALVIAYALVHNAKFLRVFIVVTLLLFMYFYPHWTGIQIPDWLSNTYYWLPSWR